MRKRKNGFTIVELLIVIVVIAILAAISIVAYNGIQARAKTSSAKTLAGSIVKKAEVFNSLNGFYPDYCQLITNSVSPTGDAPDSGVAGLGTCVAGGNGAGVEAKIDNPSVLTRGGNSLLESSGGTIVSYYGCSDGGGVYYHDYTASDPDNSIQSLNFGAQLACTK